MRDIQDKYINVIVIHSFPFYLPFYYTPHTGHTVPKLPGHNDDGLLQCNLFKLIVYQITSPEEINGIICVKAL